MARAIDARDLPRELVAAAKGGIRLGPDSPLRVDTFQAERDGVRAFAKGVRKPRRDDEHREQVALFDWARRNEDAIPALRWLFAIPNGQHSPSGAVRARMAAEGKRAGVPDVFLPSPRLCYTGCTTRCVGGLWIEMKSGRGRLSHEQAGWVAVLKRAGYAVQVCRSAAEARAALCAYLGVADPEAVKGRP